MHVGNLYCRISRSPHSVAAESTTLSSVSRGRDHTSLMKIRVVHDQLHLDYAHSLRKRTLSNQDEVSLVRDRPRDSNWELAIRGLPRRTLIFSRCLSDFSFSSSSREKKPGERKNDGYSSVTQGLIEENSRGHFMQRVARYFPVSRTGAFYRERGRRRKNRCGRSVGGLGLEGRSRNR